MTDTDLQHGHHWDRVKDLSEPVDPDLRPNALVTTLLPLARVERPRRLGHFFLLF